MRFHVLIGAVCLAIMCLVSPAEGGVIIVGQGGTGDYETISDALVASASRDEIWVRGGRYHEAIQMKVGVALYGGFPASGTPEWEERDWTANETIIDATGLNTSVVIGADDAILDGFTITGGEADDGGGVLCVSYSPTLVNCTITGNAATYTGGGVSFHSCSPTLTNCTIAGNVAVGTNFSESGGGGMFCSQSSPTLTNSTIIENTADWGGGVECYRSSPMLMNCTIAENTADSGGGVDCYTHSSPILINCTIRGNTARRNGAGVYWERDCFPTLTNCILWNRGPEIAGDSAMDATVTYSCVQFGWPGVGNIDAYPSFVDPDHGDYHLTDGSPCVDRGLITAAPPTDWEGDPRPGNDGLVDIGADESPPEYTPGPPRHMPRILYVSADAPEGGGGLSWESALNMISLALDIAGTSDEIWVAGGRYHENIVMERTVGIYGGFSGNEASREDRDCVANETIIDAAGLSTHAVIGADDAILAGFTITGGEAYLGGGVYCERSSPRLMNCTITGNAAAYAGGGVRCFLSSPTLTNCTIARNTAEYGGGLACDDAFPTLMNCTITENTADNDGGGIDCVSPASLVNCILWGNSPREISGNVHGTLVSFSCVAGGFAGTGNIDATPEFVRPWDGSSADLRLLPGSPCIDAGSNEAAVGILTDLDGNVRIWDGDDVPGAVLDMGAYEFGAPYPGDTNGDRMITGADLFTFSRWWENERNTENPACDPTGDRNIDREDLLWFYPRWRGRR